MALFKKTKRKGKKLHGLNAFSSSAPASSDPTSSPSVVVVKKSTRNILVSPSPKIIKQERPQKENTRKVLNRKKSGLVERVGLLSLDMSYGVCKDFVRNIGIVSKLRP